MGGGDPLRPWLALSSAVRAEKDSRVSCFLCRCGAVVAGSFGAAASRSNARSGGVRAAGRLIVAPS